MKASARQSGAKNGQTRPGAGKSVQTKRRTGFGNRHRADRFEREADQIATRLILGEKNLASHISPRNSARPIPISDGGFVLPRFIRDPMEESFGANLSAVRVHTSSAADSAAMNFGAQAFASGRHVYFRSGLYSPQTTASRHLLAHELVHVLQQTGRKTTQGVVAATDRTGTELPQFKPDDDSAFDDTAVSFLADDADPISVLTKRHRAGADTDESLKKLTEAVSKLATGKFPRKASSTVGDWLIKTANDGKFTDSQTSTDYTLSIPAQGFLIDCLKLCDTDDHYAAAVALLDADKKFEIVTAFAARADFRKYIRTNKDEQWLSEAFDHSSLKAPGTGRLWPYVYMHVFSQFFLSPDRGVQILYGLKEIKDGPFANVHGAKDTMLPNDRVILALELIEKYDAKRQQWLTGEQKLADDQMPKEMAVKKRYVLAEHFRSVLKAELESKQPQFWKNMLAELYRITDEAVKVWGDVISTDEQIRNAIDEVNIYGGLASFPRPVSGEFDSLKPFHDALLGLDKAGEAGKGGKPSIEPGLLYLEQKDGKPVLPTPTEYAKRIVGFDKILGLKSNEQKNVRLLLQMRLVELSLARKLPSPEGTAIGWLLFSLESFTDVLHGYDPAKDSPKQLDLFLNHRLLMARFLTLIAQVFNWLDVYTIAQIVLRGEDFAKSYLVIPGPWRRDETAAIETLMTDLSPDKRFRSMALTPRDLVFFFSGSLLEGIQKLVQAEVDRVNATPNAKAQAEQVNTDIKNLPRPWRCNPPEGFTRVIRPVDAQTTDAETLIDSSARSKEDLGKLAAEAHLGTSYYWAARSREKGDVSGSPLDIFAWITPDIRPALRQLQQTEPFKTRMSGEKAADEFEWLKVLLTKPSAAGKTLQEEISTAFQQYATQSELGAHGSMRRFTSIQRRTAATWMRTQLNKFANDSSSVNYAIPYKLADKIVEVAVAVSPSTDEKQQVALLLLDIAPELEKAFGTVSQAGRLQPYLQTFFRDAVAFSKEAAVATKANAPQKTREYYESFLHKNPKAPKEDEKLSNLLANAPLLESVIKAMEEAAKSLQMMFGFLSRDGQNLQSVLIGPAMDMTPMHLLNPFRDTPLVNDPKIRPGERYAMEIDGDDWELVKVHRKFFYHPPLSTAAPGSAAASGVMVDEDEKDIPDGRLLLTFLVNGNETKIMTGDNVTLKKLSDAVFDATLIQKLEQMGQEIEEDMNFLMDIVELVPGVGQEFAAQRALVMTVMPVVAGEFDYVLEMLKKDPVGYIKEIGLNLIEKYITLEGVLSYILLGQGGIDWSRWRKPSESKQPPSTKTPPRGKLARLIAMIRRLGGRIANAIAWIQLRLAAPLRAVQSTIGTRPRVGWLLRKALDIATWIISLIPPSSGASPEPAEDRKLAALRDLAAVDPQTAPATAPAAKESETKSLQDMLGPIGQGMAAAASEFKQQLEDFVNALAEMELPQEVFSRQLILELVADFVLLRLGAKVKFAYKALKAIGLIGKITAALDERLKGVPGDPNLLWQEYVLTKIDDRFHELRNAAVEGIYDMTNKMADETGLSFLAFGPPPLKEKDQFKIQKSEFPASELYPSPRRKVSPLPGVTELPEGEGQMLPARLRENVEKHFGHDFRHVRIHADEGSTTMLQSLGAEALTSGSHVYLSDEQQVDETKVLRHELTHVLQQTGERPLGLDYPIQPLPGRPGLGIRFYPERESEADFHARRQNATQKPVRIRKTAGIQPLGLDQALLDKLVHTFTEIDTAKDFEKTGGASEEDIQKGIHFWGALLRKIEKPDQVDFPDCFKGIAIDILTYVKHCGIEQEIPKIAALAQHPVATAKQKRKATSELNFPRFVTLFEGALFGKAGVVAQIKAKEGKGIEINKVEITFLHFGAIIPSKKEALKLWDQVISNTTGLPSVNPKAKLYNEIHQWLGSLGVQPFIWEFGKSAFRFSPDFVDTFNKTRKTQLKGAVPEKKDYLDESPTTGVGLRIGKHAGQKGEQRESHHTTQYLLVQFFRNDNRIPAWESGKDYPGIDKSSSKGRKRFTMGSTVLGLENLDKDNTHRGAGMPAILISADTHRRGQLHVERESRWSGAGDDPDSDPGQGRATQGFAIRAQFQRRLKAEFKITDDAPEWNKTISALGDDKAARGIGKAMLGTYKWMNTIMMSSLERALVTRERAYYNAMSARDGHTTADGALDKRYELNAGDMRSVYSKAVDNNDKLMKAENWTL